MATPKNRHFAHLRNALLRRAYPTRHPRRGKQPSLAVRFRSGRISPNGSC